MKPLLRTHYVVTRRRRSSPTICLLSMILIVLVTVMKLKEMLITFDRLEAQRKKLENGSHQNMYTPSPTRSETVFGTTNRTRYPVRSKMGSCPATFGKITVFIAYQGSALKDHAIAQNTLKCYLKGTTYKLVTVDVDKDRTVNDKCSKHQNFFFKRHCAAMVYLQQTDWMLVLETDIGVVNPNHCIEEWIDDRVKVILYERFINGEISPVSYMVRNTHYAMEFLQKWANMEFSAENSPSVVDKGALQIHVMKSVIPDAVQNAENCAAMLVDVNNYDTYFSYVSCVKQGLGATKIWPKKIRILRRAHAWVRDGSLSENRWSDVDFMFHGWRGNSVRVGNAPFEEMLELKKCGEGEEAWKWKRGSHVPVVQIKEKLIEFERTFAEKYPKQATDVTWLKMPDVKKCYPHCDTMG